MATIERRTIAAEVRASKGDNGELFISGYASVFNTESHDLGGFREVVAPGAFTRSLKEKRDVKALFNHDANYILGRSKNGTLTMSQDEKGLAWRCELNPAMQSHRDLHASVTRMDVDECSFAFTVNKDGQVWAERALENGGMQITRTLTDVDLFDVSAVCYPAYPGTDVAARATVVSPEVRSMIQELAAKRGLATEAPMASWEEEIAEVSAALATAFPAPAEGNWYGNGKYWVLDTYDDYVIVCEQTEGESAYWRISYAEVDDKFTFGEPVEMEKVWVPADRSAARATEMRSRMHDLAAAHQAQADAHKAEADAHQGAADATKAEADKQQARMEACSASMGNHEDGECNCQNRSTAPEDVWDSEYTDETDGDDNERAAKAVRNAERRVVVLAGLEKRDDGTVRTKTVDGKNLPASSFAFVGDKDKTETWKLPIHDADHTRNALARLDQTDGIPADKKAGVIRKIKAAAKKFGIDAASLDAAERTCPLDAEGLDDYKRRARLAMVGVVAI